METGRLERAYRIFVRCHELVAAAKTETELFQAVCRTAVEELGFRLAWVGLVSPDDARIHAVAQAGYEAGYLSAVTITTTDDARGHGPTGRAVQTGATAVSQDLASDPQFAPWREDALKRGYASSAAVPLCDGNGCFGALNLYAPEPDAFDDEEVALLEEMAAGLVLGLHRLRSEAQVRELKEHVGAAQDAEEQARTVAATIAHDVNNLLTVIALSIGEARAAQSEAPRDQALAEAEGATRSAGALMRHFLAFARRARDGADVVDVDVDVLLEESRQLLRRLAPRATLTFELAAAGARAAIGARDLSRVAINLVANAGQAAPAGGAVHVATSVRVVPPEGLDAASGRLAAGRYVELAVSDSGPGVAPDVLPHIFEPFFSTKGDAGTGLGLASVVELARASGGGVSVESTPGVGTRFAVLVPLAPRTTAAPQRSP